MEHNPARLAREAGRQNVPPIAVSFRLSVPGVLAWAWDAEGADGHRVCGITDEGQRAAGELWTALVEMPEGRATGVVRPARLDTQAERGRGGYVYGPPLVRAERDPATGDVKLLPAATVDLGP